MPEVKIVKKEIKRDPNDSSRASVSFIVHSKDAMTVREFASSHQLIEEGISACEKLPLMRVGLDNQGIPIFCDAEGGMLDISFTPEEQAKPTDYYYTVTHEYIGER